MFFSGLCSNRFVCYPAWSAMDKICRGSHVGKLFASQDKAAGAGAHDDASVPKLRIPRRTNPKEHAIHPATARPQSVGCLLDLSLKSGGAITQRTTRPSNLSLRRRFCDPQNRPTPSLEATSPCLSPHHRSPSPTFALSQDWMSHDSPQREGTVAEGCSDRLTLLSSNFKARLGRPGHSGKITGNSENWFEDATPASSTTANGFDFMPSRGKRTCYEQDSAVQRRLRLDSETERETYRMQRRHDFPEPIGRIRIEKSMQRMRRHKSVPTLGTERTITKDGDAAAVAYEKYSRWKSAWHGSQEASVLVVDAQHRTSEEMALSIMPDTPCDSPSGGGTKSTLCSTTRNTLPKSAAGQPKFLVGNEIITWESNGRRSANLCMKHGLESSGGGGSLSQKARSMVNLRDHRNSDDVRDQLNPDGVTGGAGCRGPPPQSRIQCFGEISSLPSSMQKDSAWMHSGLSTHRYTARSPGVFSPNVTRVPIQLRM